MTDHLIKVACFIKKLNICNAADLNYLVEAGPLYCLPFSNASLA